VHGAFGEHFVKSGLIDQKFSPLAPDAYDQRIEGDYAAEVLIVDQDARELIEHAKAFLEELNVY